MRLRSWSVLGALAVLGALLFSVSASGADDSTAQTYVVQMLDAPAVVYEGGTAGIPATKPGKGKKIDRKSDAVQQYVGHLNAKHDQALAEVGGAQKLYDYGITFNGFAANLTEAQATAIAKVPGVLSVEPDVVYEADTSTTPEFLGLSAKKGLWSQLGGPDAKANGKKDGAGENIIIGVIDSGITPESLSFTDQKIKKNKLGKVVYEQVPLGDPPAGWAGVCQTGEEWTAANCNNKLIGARYFNAGQGGDAGINTNRPWEFNSPRDYNGHGTHTTGTSGGNFGVPATGAAAVLGKASGMAPRARVAMYKALWSTQDSSTASGSGVDILAAIEAAVLDGVDVINYSISGTSTNFLDGAEIAFLNAADAGVFVSASAGNSGPGASTVAHPSPWITTVAAETHDRVGAGSAVIAGTTYPGASAGTGSATGQLVTFGAPASPARLCILNSLVPAAVAGKIVFCERGVNARVEKSFEVQRAGGIGMILVNPPAGGSLNADLHFVPSVHLQGDRYAAIETAALAGQTATVSGQIIHPAPAPFMAAFSSRGPLIAGAGDLLKPDIGAPGVDVLAAVAPPGQRGREFDLFSGTSMSAPHIAGIAALLKQLHPDWSPMAIKSALMTTAVDGIEPFTDTPAADASALRAFAQGAGHVQPNGAADPGLVFDSDFRDWFAFLCGATTGVNPALCAQLAAAGFSFDRSDMNVPSIAIGDLAGVQTVKRRVTNVDDKKATYSASTSINGVGVTVSPASFSIDPGETKTIDVSFTVTTAQLNRYTAGTMTLASKDNNVRIPLVVRPVAFGAQGEASSNGSPVSWQVRVGYNGPLSAAVGGLVAATPTPYTVAQDPNQVFVRTDPTGTFSFPVNVPAGAVFRTGIYEDAITPTGTDLDMYVYEGATLRGQSADGDSNEEVTLAPSTAARALTVYVHGFATNGPSATGTLFSWVVGTASAGNTTLSGIVNPATIGTQTHTATFNGLVANTRYLGRVEYTDGTNALGRTLLSIRTP